ncbi:Exosome complex component RRP42 [Grifola frondosa]|uniref:Ribosomal RNA-processing protein 42 n=1 Tax=Grifola frondosa TaxID=5627 RepID=A0A1C7M7F6_GRIFR|nr:Exosome complex component RRP42 [Grifola frondosa]
MATTTTASISKSERSYIQSSLLAPTPLRADGRSLLDYRTVLLETGVAPLANGSAKLNIGKMSHEGGGGTEVLAAVKLEVEDVELGDGADGGRVACSVAWCVQSPNPPCRAARITEYCKGSSPSAYPHLSSNALDDLQYDLTMVLQQTLAHPSLHPPNLGILPHKKSWLLNLDIVVLADAGNVVDALFMAARAALWDTKVPQTRPVQYRAWEPAPSAGDSGDMDVDQGPGGSGLDTRMLARIAADFELPDYWDEGEVLGGREKWPVCITLNVLPPVHFIDATPPEEASTALRILLMFSFPPSSPPKLQSMRYLGPGELNLAQIKSLIADGEKYARELHTALETKLRDEDLRRNVKAPEKFAVR